MQAIVRDSREFQERVSRISWIAVGGVGIFPAVLPIVLNPAAMFREFGATLFLVVFLFTAGGFVGLYTAPFVVRCLMRKDLRLAAPLVYGLSFLTVVLLALYWPGPQEGAIVLLVLAGRLASVILSVYLFSIVVRLLLPNHFDIVEP